MRKKGKEGWTDGRTNRPTNKVTSRVASLNKQFRSDNDASEVGILWLFGKILGHFGTFRDILGPFGDT